MKKIVLSESELISIIKRIVKESDEVRKAYIIVATPHKIEGFPRSGKLVWGKYKDGSTLFIPYGRYTELDSKPNIYFSPEEAEKDLVSLVRLYTKADIKLEPLK
jgi:hypothetical protein